jgi:hypothetical protein
MSYHNTYFVEFFHHSHFSKPIFVSMNCITFDTYLRLTSSDADLFFATNRCFACFHAVHRAEVCPHRSFGTPFCMRLDDPHHESSDTVLLSWMVLTRDVYRV